MNILRIKCQPSGISYSTVKYMKIDKFGLLKNECKVLCCQIRIRQQQLAYSTPTSCTGDAGITWESLEAVHDDEECEGEGWRLQRSRSGEERGGLICFARVDNSSQFSWAVTYDALSSSTWRTFHILLVLSEFVIRRSKHSQSSHRSRANRTTSKFTPHGYHSRVQYCWDHFLIHWIWQRRWELMLA